VRSRALIMRGFWLLARSSVLGTHACSHIDERHSCDLTSLLERQAEAKWWPSQLDFFWRELLLVSLN